MGMLASMSTQLKLRLGTGLITMVLLLSGVITNFYLKIALTAVVYLWVAYPVLWSAARDLFVRHRMSEQFLMAVATFGALGLQDFPEALAVMVFYLIGEAFEDYASQRSHNEIASLVKLKPNKVRLIHEDGSEELVAPRKVKIGQRIRVLAGEAVALDGALVDASASVDMSALTGESEPALFTCGQEVPSGVINMGKVIELTVTRDNKNSSITRLINLIEDAAANKSKPEALITRFAVYYTPIVVGCAVLLALVGLLPDQDFSNWLTRGLVFLVVSCPCALVLSVPLSFFGGLGAMSKTGVMVKGSIHIEALAKLKSIALDKTGTITQGKFSVSAIDCYGAATETEIMQALYALESLTTHPIGVAIVNYCKEQGYELKEASEVQEITGFGLQGQVNGKSVAVGKERLVTEKLGLTIPTSISEHEIKGNTGHAVVGTELYVVLDGAIAGRVTLADTVKPSALPFFDAMHDLGVKTYMITGDKKDVAANIAAQCHISAFYAEQLPEDKLNTFKAIKNKDGVTAYVGDGINDAPTLASSDVGIAMGQFGSAAAVEAADVVVMNDDLTKIPTTIKLAQQTYHLAMQNMVFVIAVKALILLLGALGYANIWIAILGDVGLCVLAVLNAMRPLAWVKTNQAVPLKPELA